MNMDRELSVEVETDGYTETLTRAFDYTFTGRSTFHLPAVTFPDEFHLGLVIGRSGSGKTQILKRYFGFHEQRPRWDSHRAIVSHFATPDEAIEKLFAVGLNSIPTLCKPYHVLSNGEAFRANIARQICSGAVIDEFTSVVNRSVAKSLSTALARYIRKQNLSRVVLASCHSDIVEWLEPDWVFDTDYHRDHQAGLFTNGFDPTLRRPCARIEIYSA